MKKIMLTAWLIATFGIQGSVESSSWSSIFASMLFWKKAEEAVPKSTFVVKEIDYQDQEEVEKVVEFRLSKRFDKNKLTQAEDDLLISKHKRANEKQELLKSMKARDGYKSFICISQKNKQVCGELSCRYGYRRPEMVEYMKVIVGKDYDFNEVMFALNNHAEQAFAALSMKQIANSVWSKREYVFYLKNGFVIMDRETKLKDHYITSDGVVALWSLVTVLPLLFLAAVDYGVVYKDIQ